MPKKHTARAIKKGPDPANVPAPEHDLERGAATPPTPAETEVPRRVLGRYAGRFTLPDDFNDPWVVVPASDLRK